MNRMRFLFTVIIILVWTLPLSGCGLSGGIYDNYRAMEELRMVETLGVDLDDGDVTLSAAADGQGGAGEPLRLRQSGGGFRLAMDSLRDHVPQGELFFAHTRYTLAGRTAAEEGLEKLLSFAERDEGLRLGTTLFLLEEGKAGDLVTDGEEGFQVTEALASAARDAEERCLKPLDLRETVVALDEYGAAPVCLLRDSRPEGQKKSLTPDGYGILKGGRLAGTLEGDAAEAAGLLLGNPGVFTLRVKGGTLRCTAAGRELTPVWNADGSPGPLEVKVRVRAVVAEDGGTDPEPEALTGQLRAVLEDALRTALDRARELDADYLGLGRAMRLSGGRRFSALPSDWLTEMEFRITVDAAIDRSSELMGKGGEGQ